MAFMLYKRMFSEQDNKIKTNIKRRVENLREGGCTDLSGIRGLVDCTVLSIVRTTSDIFVLSSVLSRHLSSTCSYNKCFKWIY